MSKKALYRTNVAIVETYSGWVDGESATWVSPIAWTKGNLQPYKQGVMSSIDEAGVMFKDWRVLYIKTLPEVDYSTKPTNLTDKNKTYFYYEGSWYDVQGEQDWTMQARGVKHYKLLAIKSKQPPESLVGELTPTANLVEDLEYIVNELTQVNNIVKEVI